MKGTFSWEAGVICSISTSLRRKARAQKFRKHDDLVEGHRAFGIHAASPVPEFLFY